MAENINDDGGSGKLAERSTMAGNPNDDGGSGKLAERSTMAENPNDDGGSGKQLAVGGSGNIVCGGNQVSMIGGGGGENQIAMDVDDGVRIGGGGYRVSMIGGGGGENQIAMEADDGVRVGGGGYRVSMIGGGGENDIAMEADEGGNRLEARIGGGRVNVRGGGNQRPRVLNVIKAVMFFLSIGIVIVKSTVALPLGKPVLRGEKAEITVLCFASIGFVASVGELAYDAFRGQIKPLGYLLSILTNIFVLAINLVKGWFTVEGRNAFTFFTLGVAVAAFVNRLDEIIHVLRGRQ